MEATEYHASNMAAHMRDADRRECMAATGQKPIQALLAGIAVSRESYTALLDDQPVCMFGVVDGPLDGVGLVWLLGTDKIKTVAREFHRGAKHWLRKLERGYALVGNVMDARNEVHLKWVHRLGFEVKDYHEGYGTNGETFLEIWKRTDNV